MHVPLLGSVKVSLSWPRPKVWPTSWHITMFFQASLLYLSVVKYESFILVVPCVIWSPLSQIEAIPSQPLLPYFALQTSTRPVVAPHLFALLWPPTTEVSSESDLVQSTEVVFRKASQ